ncbi:MAG: DUF3305 domain-containing protein [Gammaproteobacteria bacterium]|nr:DUF3305 domain-containing protein [Gammaproteobacteria bacterium]
MRSPLEPFATGHPGRFRFPVSVLLERRIRQRGRWSFPYWQVAGVVSGDGDSGQDPRRALVHEDDECRRYLWTGMWLELFRDGTESYWHNLKSSQPSLFVICSEHEDDADDRVPILVTADHDEAHAYLEGGDDVFAVSIPPFLYQMIERYVVDYYQPGEEKKRKRKHWKSEAPHGTPTPESSRKH